MTAQSAPSQKKGNSSDMKAPAVMSAYMLIPECPCCNVSLHVDPCFRLCHTKKTSREHTRDFYPKIHSQLMTRSNELQPQRQFLLTTVLFRTSFSIRLLLFSSLSTFLMGRRKSQACDLEIYFQDLRGEMYSFSLSLFYKKKVILGGR